MRERSVQQLESGLTVSVSVVIPCFECADTVGRAVDSVVAQSSLPLEVILIDDCTPSERTRLVLRELAARYPGWVVLRRAPINMGPGSARNIGWRIARGKYIAFLDADDIWHPDKLSSQFEWMEANPEFALSSHRSELVESPDELSRHAIEIPLVVREIDARSQVLRNRHGTRCVMVKCDIENRFEEGKRYSEDYLLWTEIGLSGVRMAYLDSVLAASFREPFSVGGLSGNLWKMQLGGWQAQLYLYRSGKISLFLFVAAASFGLVRFIRRLMIASVRRSRGSGGR